MPRYFEFTGQPCPVRECVIMQNRSTGIPRQSRPPNLASLSPPPQTLRSSPTNTKNVNAEVILFEAPYVRPVRPAIGRMLINVDISAGATYILEDDPETPEYPTTLRAPTPWPRASQPARACAPTPKFMYQSRDTMQLARPR
ncbi:hypothetical protein BJV78DRAFT_1284409 [Lactifluus subvellereus]|nr:hypothetical protein BJV78DRAFT_1284409 [Lactifluus subvellereus]